MKTETIVELERTLAEGPVNLIDVREVFEYESGHVPSAKNMPLSRFEKDYVALDKNQVYHIICQSGIRSTQAVAFLEQAGYQAINIEGGTSAWAGPLT